MKKHASLQAYGALAPLLVIACFLFVSCEDGLGYQPTTQIHIDQPTLNLHTEDEQTEIIITVIKSSVIKDTYILEWESSDNSVAAVIAKEPDYESIFDDWADITISTTITLNVKPIGEGTARIAIVLNNSNVVKEEQETVYCDVTVSGTVVSRPTAAPPAGEVLNGTKVTLSAKTSGVEIWYTTNGGVPAKDGAGSSKYTDPITITEPVTIKAIAVKDGMADSGMLTAAYTIMLIAMPTAMPPAGEVSLNSTITLTTTTQGAEIYYTTDGSDPTISSTKYSNSSPLIITGPVTVKVIAVKDGNTSDMLTAAYTVSKAATPTADPPEGAVPSGTTVELSTTTPGAVIYYTTNGNKPTTSSLTYNSPITITGETTIKAFAFKAGWIESDVLTVTYTIE